MAAQPSGYSNTLELQCKFVIAVYYFMTNPLLDRIAAHSVSAIKTNIYIYIYLFDLFSHVSAVTLQCIIAGVWPTIAGDTFPVHKGNEVPIWLCAGIMPFVHESPAFSYRCLYLQDPKVGSTDSSTYFVTTKRTYKLDNLI